MQAAGLGTELFAAVLKFVPQTELWKRTFKEHTMLPRTSPEEPIIIK